MVESTLVPAGIMTSNPHETTIRSSIQNTDTITPVYKVYAGYQINQYVAVQGAHHDLGNNTLSATSDGSGISCLPLLS
jgi:hypothetical protein